VSVADIDFIAVGEYLISSGVTAHGQLALHGVSGGGLLVGAVMTQRPDLAAMALPMVGVMDMLRFHKFTIGAAWIPEQGDPDVAEDFAFLYAYSPLHALRPRTCYPATLILSRAADRAGPRVWRETLRRLGLIGGRVIASRARARRG
jgi:prolyl oligopeptidase